MSAERKIFMDLVKTEIGRLNKQLVNKGTVSLVFHAGGVQVKPHPEHRPQQQVFPGKPSVSAERKIFLDLVTTEIGRLTKQLVMGTVSLVSTPAACR